MSTTGSVRTAKSSRVPPLQRSPLMMFVGRDRASALAWPLVCFSSASTDARSRLFFHLLLLLFHLFIFISRAGWDSAGLSYLFKPWLNFDDGQRRVNLKAALVPLEGESICCVPSPLHTLPATSRLGGAFSSRCNQTLDSKSVPRG